MQLRVPHQNAILLRRQLFRGWIDQNEEERPLNITSTLYLPWTIESHPSTDIVLLPQNGNDLGMTEVMHSLTAYTRQLQLHLRVSTSNFAARRCAVLTDSSAASRTGRADAPGAPQ